MLQLQLVREDLVLLLDDFSRFPRHVIQVYRMHIGQMYRKDKKRWKNNGWCNALPIEGLKEKESFRFRRISCRFFFAFYVSADLWVEEMHSKSFNHLILSKQLFPALENYSWVYGVFMSVLVGLVIVGGNKKYFPCCLVCGSFYVHNLSNCLQLYSSHTCGSNSLLHSYLIFEQAFSPDAGFGGFLGVLIIGIKRAVFK